LFQLSYIINNRFRIFLAKKVLLFPSGERNYKPCRRRERPPHQQGNQEAAGEDAGEARIEILLL
jgi:hypothetical protein